MTEYNLPAFLGLLSLLFLAVFYRLGNMRVSMTFESKTIAPEPSKAEAARMKTEQDAFERRQVAELGIPTKGDT